MKLPEPTAETLRDLQQVAKFLDRIADSSVSNQTHVQARALATATYRAIERVEALAGIVEDFAGLVPLPATDRRN